MWKYLLAFIYLNALAVLMAYPVAPLIWDSNFGFLIYYFLYLIAFSFLATLLRIDFKSKQNGNQRSVLIFALIAAMVCSRSFASSLYYNDENYIYIAQNEQDIVKNARDCRFVELKNRHWQLEENQWGWHSYQYNSDNEKRVRALVTFPILDADSNRTSLFFMYFENHVGKTLSATKEQDIITAGKNALKQSGNTFFVYTREKLGAPALSAIDSMRSKMGLDKLPKDFLLIEANFDDHEAYQQGYKMILPLAFIILNVLTFVALRMVKN